MVNIKSLINQGKYQLTEYWNKPREGECLSNKEGLFYTLTASGMNIYNFMGNNGFGFAASATFAGAIMGIRQVDFATLTLISTVLSYVLIWMSPINMLIYENHGVLNKKTRIYAHCGAALMLIAAICLYFVPSTAFESIIKGLPQLIANTLVINVFNMYTDWFVRKKFSKKYGRIKPFIIAYGVPLFVMSCAIAYFPADMEYTKKLILLNLMFGLISTMHADFSQSETVAKFISNNTQERQRLFSIVPIISYALVSLMGIIYPLLINGRQNNQSVYKICVPIFCGLGIAMAYSVLGCKERVIENTSGNEQKVKFFSAAKNVLRDEYLWMNQISSVFNTFTYLTSNLLNLWLLYSLRMSRYSGLIGGLIAVPCTLGNLITPILTRRFNKRPLLLAGRACRILVLLGDFWAISVESIPLFVIFNMILSVTSGVENGVNSGMLPDILDRHQWKYGERCDAMMGVFGWFIPLLTTPIGYVMPYLQKQIGFTSDWNILYDNEIALQVFQLYIVMNIVGVVLVTLPYAFYNITNEKHKMYISEIKQRVANEIAQQEKAEAELVAD